MAKKKDEPPPLPPGLARKMFDMATKDSAYAERLRLWVLSLDAAERAQRSPDWFRSSGLLPAAG